MGTLIGNNFAAQYNAVNGEYERINNRFLSEQALLKTLYLATFEVTKNGHCRFVALERSMVSFLSCWKVGFQSK